jgi:hypothetical protein
MGLFTDVDEFLGGQTKTAAGLLGLLKSPILSAANLVGTVADTVKQQPQGVLLLGGGLLGAHAVHNLVRDHQQTKVQDEVFKMVQRGDPILLDAAKDDLESAFSTLRTFAPSLAMDPNVVRSFLREAVTSGGGVNYNTVNLLAKTENAVSGGSSNED